MSDFRNNASSHSMRKTTSPGDCWSGASEYTFVQPGMIFGFCIRGGRSLLHRSVEHERDRVGTPTSVQQLFAGKTRIKQLVVKYIASRPFVYPCLLYQLLVHDTPEELVTMLDECADDRFRQSQFCKPHTRSSPQQRSMWTRNGKDCTEP